MRRPHSRARRATSASTTRSRRTPLDPFTSTVSPGTRPLSRWATVSSNVVAWRASASPASRAASTAKSARRPTPTSSSAPAATTARPISRWASSAIPPSSSMSPSTATSRPASRRAATVSSAARTETGLALYVSSRILTPPTSRHTPRPPIGRAAASPRAISSSVKPSAAPTAAAASALIALWRPAKASVTGCSASAASSVNPRPCASSTTSPTRRTCAVAARHPGDARVVGVERDPAGGGHGAHERRLLLVHAVERAEELRVDGRHVRHDAERRPRQLRQVGDLAGPVGAELEHERLVLGDEPEEREREPPLVVEARRGLEDLPARAEYARDQLLGRRLAVGTGHGHNRNRKPRAMICGEQAERLCGVLDEDERHIGWRVVVQCVDDQARGA